MNRLTILPEDLQSHIWKMVYSDMLKTSYWDLGIEFVQKKCGWCHGPPDPQFRYVIYRNSSTLASPVDLKETDCTDHWFHEDCMNIFYGFCCKKDECVICKKKVYYGHEYEVNDRKNRCIDEEPNKITISDSEEDEDDEEDEEDEEEF
jgi:hypothetical protein